MPIKYRRTVLPNGLTVVSERIPYTRSVAAGFWIARGSRDESARDNGITHLIEHLSFKGTATRSARDIALSMESIGGHLDAFTTKEETCFYARALDEHLPRAVDIIADIVCRPRFSPRDLSRERKVVLEEIKSLEDAPDDQIHDHFDQVIFDGHPLARPIIGTAATCRSFTREGIMAYRARHFGPGDTVVAVAGNVDHKRLVALLAGLCPGRCGARRTDKALRPPRIAGGLTVVRRDIAQVHLCLGFPAIPYTHPDRYALMLLSTMLGGGMSSRLFQAIREEAALAYAVNSYLELYRDTGVFGVYLGTSPARIQQAADMVLAEIRKVAAGPVPAAEFASAQAQLKGNMILGMESITNRMMRMAKTELIGEPHRDVGHTIRMVEAVRREDVARVARALCTPRRLSAALLGPVKRNGFTLHREILA
jgi:predicted Zn-dependent peptidase